jgi:hypothetical protein
VHAERRPGELLAGMEKQHGGCRKKQKMDSPPDESISTMKSLGITHNQSSQWQQLAKIPEPEFERRLAKASEQVETLTTKQLLRPANTTKKPERAKPQPIWSPEDQFIFDVQAIIQLFWHQLTVKHRADVLAELRQMFDELEKETHG